MPRTFAAPSCTSEFTQASACIQDYLRVRAVTEDICAPLETEDYVIQSMADVSPPKWHLAHVTWFFETFVLLPFLKDYQVLDPVYDYLFNSYYETHGKPFPRPRRGLVSRPTVQQVYHYRTHVDAAMEQRLSAPPEEEEQEIIRRVILGINHEQQHQELLLMDIKHIFAQNPLKPVYRADLAVPPAAEEQPLTWHGYPEGIRSVGHNDTSRSPRPFAFDNESPRHRQYVGAFQLASRPVSNGEFIAFIADGGYQRPELWLSDGWNLVQQQGWRAPLYWENPAGDGWVYHSFNGLREVDTSAPVSHVSFYEADAFASWAGARLPTEAEWEVAAQDLPTEGNFLESDWLQPVPGKPLADQPGQLFGDAWEWTSSAYRPYPGFKALAGSLGEYNGKFMSGQMVLRGGCCATPRSHIRATYRNFFPPHARWAFSGFRLAREA